MIVIEESEKKQLIQETVDRILYCPGFKEKLIKLLTQYNPNDEVKISSNPSEFNFPN